MYDPGTRGMPQKYVLPAYTIHYTGRDWGERGSLCMFALKKKKKNQQIPVLPMRDKLVSYLSE